ncbi:unnamed protein product [Dracunculus medinensis]|uniref:Large ribosomal subunit protein bL19m n=1 Tax=Dracunculus medinensis TaxID=318479 RepID=A0A158Q3D6_DRAME|nr:unnamed protein product [Dracunculus medinensis]
MSEKLLSHSGDSIRKRIANFPQIYPDFIPTPIWGRRNALREELERADMIERRMQLDIPEFYVGSIVAVTLSDPNTIDRKNRFLGICIRREREGLKHQFTLRNVIDGLGVEIMYEMYNPTILKIETIRLEKRLDDDLSYLIDALPEYSRFDIHMEPVAHTIGKPVPINETKVQMRNPPWSRRWELYDYKGIDFCWPLVNPFFKRKFYQKTKVTDYRKYDLIADKREAGSDLETEWLIEDEMREYDRQRHKRGDTKKRLLYSAADASIVH